MIRPSEVQTDHITGEMIGRAYKVYDHQTKQNFYQVESSNFANNGKEYEVRYSKEHGFTNTKYGFCSHVAIAMAASKEEAAAMAEISIAQAKATLEEVAPMHVLILENGRSASTAEYNRVMNAQPKKSGKGCYQPKAFSILK